VRRALVVLLAVEAAAFGIGVLWVLFAGSLLQADVDGAALPVAVALCVLHLAAAMALGSGDGRPGGLLWPTLAVQVPIAAWAATRGEPLYYVLATLAAVVLVAGAGSTAAHRGRA
jgi:hypothetical protein